MFGVGVGVRVGGRTIVSSGGGGFDSDYQAVLDYATTQGYTLPSAGQQILQNQLVLDLKTGGIWSKLDTFAVFATDGSSNFALIDWKRLTTYTAVNSPTFTSNGGFAGNGLTSYISTNFNPATSGVNYTLNNAGRSFWVDNRTILTGDSWEGLANSLGNKTVNSNSAVQRINSTNSLNSAVAWNMDEFHSINRTSSTNVELFTNTTQYSRTQTSVAIVSENQLIGRANPAYNSSRFRFYAMGGSLVSENTSFYNAINTYITSL